MKFSLPRATWALAIAATVLCTPQSAAAYQSEQGLEHGRGHDKKFDDDGAYRRNPAFQQGWNHGQEDRARNRNSQYRLRFSNDFDRRSYQYGYDQGFLVINLQQDRQYGRYENNGNTAARSGYRDGRYEGQNDRATGRGNRPTLHTAFRSANRGYTRSYGSRRQFQREYRQAYLEGYQEGFQGRSDQPGMPRRR